MTIHTKVTLSSISIIRSERSMSKRITILSTTGSALLLLTAASCDIARTGGASDTASRLTEEKAEGAADTQAVQGAAVRASGRLKNCSYETAILWDGELTAGISCPSSTYVTAGDAPSTTRIKATW